MHGTHAYAPHVTYTSRTRPPRACSASIPTYDTHLLYTPQGLSRFASDIIIRGFDTPCKLGFYDGKLIYDIAIVL